VSVIVVSPKAAIAFRQDSAIRRSLEATAESDSCLVINPLCGCPSAILAEHARSPVTSRSEAASVQLRCAVKGCYRKASENTFQSWKWMGNSCVHVSRLEEKRMVFHLHYSAAAYCGDRQTADA
jgi:hypothetical protein